MANILSGFGGEDRLVGLAGNDTLEAGARARVLNGGAGADVLNGGDGIDTIEYAGAAVNVVIGGIGAGGEAQGDMVGADIENISGTNGGDDHLTGSAAANRLDGGAGHDFLVGGAGADAADRRHRQRYRLGYREPDTAGVVVAHRQDRCGWRRPGRRGRQRTSSTYPRLPGLRRYS